MSQVFKAVRLLLPLAFEFSALTHGQVPPTDLEARTLLERAVAVRPSDRQVAWQEREFIAFAHFGPNTFSDREWGTGQEKPAVFNPTELDCRQWVRVLKDAGVHQVILTAKHHDGFCLWPSRFTEHSVKNSPWRDGRGDVVRELAEACREGGLKLGLYLSPADLNAIERGVYGQTEAKPRVIPTPVPGWTPKRSTRREAVLDDYNTYFLNQLFELLTEYGEISEVWFDGANPKPGTNQRYAYAEWYSLIRELQPGAVIFGKGPDVRWCGNEAGQGRASEWSVVPLPVSPDQFDWPDMTDADLGSLNKLKGASYLHWYPSEVDVSIRPGWFWHEKENAQVKSLEKLTDIYFASAGHNAVLLLNVPPDRRGLIHEADAARLHEFGDWLRATFREDLAQAATVTASHTRAPNAEFSASNTADANPNTFWAPEEWQSSAELTFNLAGKKRFNVVSLQEHIRSGQRIELVAVDAKVADDWKEVGRGTTVGYRKLLRFPAVESDQVRVRILNARICPTLASVSLFLENRPAPFPGQRSDWNGFDRYDFPFRGKQATVVVPKQAAPGKPWVWHGEFFGHKPAPDIALLEKGCHIVYLSLPDMLGCPDAVAQWDAFYAELTQQHGFGKKAALVGLSRGGLYCYNWAAKNPGKVACIYGDAPVCDFKSWPGGKGKGKGSASDWQLVLQRYHFNDEAEALAYNKNPVDSLAPLAEAHVPLLHVYGDADDVVPWDENTGVMAERYRKLGGDMTLIAKPGIGHHPHGLEDSTPIVEFLWKNLRSQRRP